MRRHALFFAAGSLLLSGAIACSDDASRPTDPAVPDVKLVTDVGDAILYLRFDHEIIDESPYTHKVDFVGTPGFGLGCNDAAAMMEGDEYAIVDPSPVLQPEHVTVEVWFSPKRDLGNGTGFHPLVVKYAGNFWNTVDGYDLWYQDSGAGGRLGFGIGTANGTIRKHASLWKPLVASRLYHVVGTFDGQNAKLYLDGDLVAVTPHSQPLAYLGSGIRIGGGVFHSYYGGWQYYRGLVDQVAIYPRAMDAEEIRDRYESCGQRYLLNTTGDGSKDDGSFTD